MGRTVIVKDLGFLGEVDIVCEYDHQPKEPGTRTDPGCGEGITLTAAKGYLFRDCAPLDLLTLLHSSRGLLEELEQEILDTVDADAEAAIERRNDELREAYRTGDVATIATGLCARWGFTP